ncbi:MAG: glycosyltransferase [Magnetospirillum sp. WYHS-4]
MRNIVAAAVVAAVLHAGAWVVAHKTISPPDFEGAFDSLSFSTSPPQLKMVDPSPEEIEKISGELRTVASVTDTIRLYASAGRYGKIVELAKEQGLNVIVGAWLDKGAVDANREEVEAAIALANKYSNVRAVVIGNETILREDMGSEELIGYLRQARKRVRVPVTTGETWKIWQQHPEIVNEVDFIAVHILPYWEGVPAEAATRHAVERYGELKQSYPGKRVVIAEFGWPSQGYNFKLANAEPMIQAGVVREFVAEARRRGMEYNLIEAFDQPWKVDEGSVGPYWGIFDAGGIPKFNMSGIVETRHLARTAIVALAIGLAISLLALSRRHPTFAHALVFAGAANALAAGIGLAAMYPFDNYLNFGSALAWVIGFVLMWPLTAMTLVKVHEMAEVILGRRPRRLIPAEGAFLPIDGSFSLPKVSIQIPAYKERPEMLKETLDSCAALDYPDFEVVVIINNTPEEHYWKPIEEHCERLGARFKFVNLPKVAGFKAGALNVAMDRVDPEAGILALLDADYVVHRDWLKHLVPAFADQKVALVQAPQDHRDGEQTFLKSVMNSEYAGFFDIGMVQRNEDDAIVAHGTMLLIRRSAFDEVGGWATDTITEDTELGLRLIEAGYESLYTSRRYGWGLLPDTYKAFKTQRHRWAYGAMQIMRKHAKHMRLSSKTLSSAQKFQFVTGWSYWLSDAFGVGAAVLNLFWVPMIVLVGVLIPTLPFTLPILAAFAVNLLHCAVLYAERVKLPIHHIGGAALASMSLQFTIANALFMGILKDNLPFLRTDKGGNAKAGATKAGETSGFRPLAAVKRFLFGRKEDPARWETRLGLALMAGATAVIATNKLDIVEINVFAATLIVQATPFLTTTLMVAAERWEIAWRQRRVAAEPAIVPAE